MTAAAHLLAAGNPRQQPPTFLVELFAHDIGVQEVKRCWSDGELKAVAFQRGRRVEQSGVVNGDALGSAQGSQILRMPRRVAVRYAIAAVPTVRETGSGLYRNGKGWQGKAASAGYVAKYTALKDGELSNAKPGGS